MKNIKVYQGDITKLSVDAIVNAANKSLLGGGGVDGAIHRVAGPELLAECRTLHGCKTGEAKITKGYKLPAKYVIHTVGPIYSGKKEDAGMLANCYINSLELAAKNDIHSIAFPAISTGVYGYPLGEATYIATKAVYHWLLCHDDYKIEVIYCCFDGKTADIYGEFVTPKGFQQITRYAELLKETNPGEWHTDNENDGSIEHPIQMPFVVYSSLVRDFEEDFFDFCESHPEYEHTKYGETLQTNGLEWGTESMSNAEVEEMDAKGIIALITGAHRAERFCDGALKEFYESGVMYRWVSRLAELEVE